MFKWYGLFGILFILFFQISIILGLDIPFTTFAIWFGYVLMIDCFTYMIKHESYIMNKRRKLLIMAALSIVVWFMFETINVFSKSQGWYYANLTGNPLLIFLRTSLAFAMIIPAILETSDLIGALHLFRKIKPKLDFHINRFIVSIFFATGIIFIFLPFVITTPWIWFFVWVGFVTLIDPILYFFHDKKSLFYQVQEKKFTIILSLILAGYVCGFLWEFWNHWSHTKWYYTVPILENIKIFEIPLIGFLAYGPFALELYVMYQFIKLVLSRKFLGRNLHR